jgi:alkanesulfonate monooxygenase
MSRGWCEYGASPCRIAAESREAIAMKVFGFFPTSGDGRYLGTTQGARPVTPGYLGQIAAAIDDLGYDGALLPTGRGCEDAWVTAATLVPATRRIRFLVAVRPGLMSPGLAARMTSTFDRLSGGRLLINVVTGGDPEELAGDGVHLGHDLRYELTDEFLEVWRGLCRGEQVDFQGRHLRIDAGRLMLRPLQDPHPPLYFRGLVAGGPPRGGEACGCLPDLGRAARGRRREGGRCPRPRGE